MRHPIYQGEHLSPVWAIILSKFDIESRSFPLNPEQGCWGAIRASFPTPRRVDIDISDSGLWSFFPDVNALTPVVLLEAIPPGFLLAFLRRSFGVDLFSSRLIIGEYVVITSYSYI